MDMFPLLQGKRRFRYYDGPLDFKYGDDDTDCNNLLLSAVEHAVKIAVKDVRSRLILLNGETVFAFCSIFSAPIDKYRHCCYIYIAVTFVTYILERMQHKPFVLSGEDMKMTLIQRRILILIIVVIAAAVLGRLAVRAVINLLLGGTLFGGNFL